MHTEIMTLNNDIAVLQKKHEKIEDKKNKIKSEAEESSSKKMSKISELALLLMAVDNLYNKCQKRKEKSKLKYNITGEEHRTFDDF